MADYYKQRHLSPKERDEAVTAITLISLAIAGTISIAVAGRKQKGVGKPTNDTQLSFDYIFDDELGLYDPNKQEAPNKPNHTDPPTKEEEFWAQTYDHDETVRQNTDWFGEYYSDEDTGENWPAETAIEIFYKGRGGMDAMAFYSAIEGEDLQYAYRMLTNAISEIMNGGADAYIYINGALANEIPYNRSNRLKYAADAAALLPLYKYEEPEANDGL